MLRDEFIQKRMALRAEFKNEIKSYVQKHLKEWDGTLDSSFRYRVIYSANKWRSFFSEEEIGQVLDEFCREEGCTHTSLEYFLGESGGEFCFRGKLLEL